MTPSQDHHDSLEPLVREALSWIIRLTSGAATREDARSFEAWRGQTPAHAAAVREAVAFRAAVRAMDLPSPESSANVVAFERPRVRLPERRAFLLGAGGAIAASVAVSVVNPPLGLWPSWSELTADQRTPVGERRRLSPMPGVLVELNARSSLSRTGGGLALVEGEAFVAVEPRLQDLRIRVRDGRILMRRGELNLRTSERETCVTCLKGSATLLHAGARHELSGGDEVLFRQGHAAARDRVDAARASAWRQGLLMYRNTPLSRVIEDINRYRGGKIILADRALANRPVNGIFHTDQIDNAVVQIQQLLRLDVRQLPGGVTLLT